MDHEVAGRELDEGVDDRRIRAVFKDFGSRFRRPNISFSWTTRSLRAGTTKPADRPADLDLYREFLRAGRLIRSAWISVSAKTIAS